MWSAGAGYSTAGAGSLEESKGFMLYNQVTQLIWVWSN